MKKLVSKNKEKLVEKVANSDNEVVGSETVSMEKMEKFLDFCSNMFGLLPEDNYRLTSFIDKGNSIKGVLDNDSITLTVEVHNCEEQGITTE